MCVKRTQKIPSITFSQQSQRDLFSTIPSDKNRIDLNPKGISFIKSIYKFVNHFVFVQYNYYTKWKKSSQTWFLLQKNKFESLSSAILKFQENNSLVQPNDGSRSPSMTRPFPGGQSDPLVETFVPPTKLWNNWPFPNIGTKKNFHSKSENVEWKWSSFRWTDGWLH